MPLPPFFQSTNFDYRFLRNKLITISHTLVGTEAATAANYGAFHIVTKPCVVEEVRESHSTVGSDGSAVTVGLEKLTSGTAPGSGVSALASEFDLKGTINVPVKGTLSATPANLQLAIGDRLALDDTGTLTAVAGLTMTVVLRIR